MAGFFYRLEYEDGTPADPPTLHAAVPNWRPGDTIPLGAGRTLRVIEIRPGSDPDEVPMLVVNALQLLGSWAATMDNAESAHLTDQS